MRNMSKTISPPKPSRVSVPVSAEVLEAFQRLAKASNTSTGRAIAEWLSDTVEAAQFMAAKMEQARSAPKAVMREMHAYALGMVDETSTLMRQITEKGKAARAVAPGQAQDGTGATVRAAATPAPPSCNTGGKLPKAKRTKGALQFPLFTPTPPKKARSDTKGVPPKDVK